MLSKFVATKYLLPTEQRWIHRRKAEIKTRDEERSNMLDLFEVNFGAVPLL